MSSGVLQPYLKLCCLLCRERVEVGHLLGRILCLEWRSSDDGLDGRMTIEMEKLEGFEIYFEDNLIGSNVGD